MLVQEEVRLKNQGTRSINLVSNQGVGKNGKRHAKGNRGTIILMSPPLKYIRRKIRMISVVFVENMDIYKKIA